MLTGPASWWWPFPASPGSAAAGCHRRTGCPSPALAPGHCRSPGAGRPAGTAGEGRGGGGQSSDTLNPTVPIACSTHGAGPCCGGCRCRCWGHCQTPPAVPGALTHLLVETKSIDLREHPAHAAVPPTHQDPEGGELLEEAQPGRGTGERGWGLCRDPARATPRRTGQRLPQVWATVHEVKDLGRVEELLELAQKLDALVVPALGVDEGQERAGAGRGAGGLPETCGEPKRMSPQPRLPPPQGC